MEERKRNIRWLLLSAVLVILLLLLTMCTGRRSGGPEETEPAPAAAAAAQTELPAVTEETEQNEETTEATQVTTAPTEETTEATEEETTAAATEATEAEDDDEDFGEEEEYVEFPDPGTPENPYVEVTGGYPAEVETVKIPRDVNISYLITGSAGSVITIKEPGVTLTIGETVYSADETTGELTVDLSKLGTDPVIRLSHSGRSAASCILTLSEGLGGAGNPEPLTDPAELEVLLPEGDANGYHYIWTSTITGQVELTLKEKEAEETEQTPAEPAGDPEETPGDETGEDTPPEELPSLEVIVTVGDKVFRLSECEEGKLTFDVEKAADVLIQVIAQPFADGTYPEIGETLLWTLLPAVGTAENPEIVDSIEAIPVALEQGDAYGHHFQWTADTYGTVNLTADKAELEVVVTVGDTTAKRSENPEGTLSFHVDKGQSVLIQAVAVAQASEETPEMPVYPGVNGTISGTIQPDTGTPENPEMLDTLGTVTVILGEGDSDGHTFRWTAPYGGTLEMTAEKPEKHVEVILTNTADGIPQRLSESTSGYLTAEAVAGDEFTIQVIAISGEDGTYAPVGLVLESTFTAAPGSSAENPIVISDPQAGATFAVEASQTLYFSGMVHEMVATVEDASGVSLHHDGRTSWGNLTGVAELEFPEADAEQPEKPVVFSVTSKKNKELTLTFAYPTGHVRNPAPLKLGINKLMLEENETDGYHLVWTAEADGQLTVAVESSKGWQYRLDNGETGALYTSSQEPVTAEQTIGVKAGDQVALTVWTMSPEEDGLLPAGTVTVTAGFYDPLLGTQAKPIRLEAEGELSSTVVIPVGQTLYYTADAEGMVLTLTGQNVTLLHNGTEHYAEKGTLKLLCHGAEPLFRISNSTDQDQSCTLRFAYPQGHLENPASMVMGENAAVLEEGALSGYTFAWTAESSGILTITMTGDSGWQYILRNETTGVDGIVHTSEDQPAAPQETLEVEKGDRILVIVNTFDPEHPLKTPAGEVTFTAEFVDPTLGLEENPIWLNLEDTITIPAGKTMYCTAKADGMVMTLQGANAVVSHNGAVYTGERNEITVSCVGTGTFGHPVFAITNTGTEDGTYTVSFSYPEGHFLNPAPLALGDTVLKAEALGKCGYYFLWTAEKDGTFTFTLNTENGWMYTLANLAEDGPVETCLDGEEVPAFQESVPVFAGDQIRIQVNILEADGEGAPAELSCTAVFTPAQNEEP